jgi:hypothetical protein
MYMDIPDEVRWLSDGRLFPILIIRITYIRNQVGSFGGGTDSTRVNLSRRSCYKVQIVLPADDHKTQKKPKVHKPYTRSMKKINRQQVRFPRIKYTSIGKPQRVKVETKPKKKQ